MTGHYSRRVLEVRGISPAVLKHHPGVGDVNDLCDGDEFPATFSNSPGRWSVTSDALSYSTLYSSASSLDDDEFEKESTETIQQLFNNVDSILYADEESHAETVQLHEECQEWADQYYHLRILGKQLIPEGDHGYQTVTAATDKLNLNSSFDSDDSLESKLGIHGRQMGIAVPMDTPNSQNKDLLEADQHEEILFLEGEYEELIAVDYSGDSSPHETRHLQAGAETNISVQKLSAIKENLCSLLGNKIWNEVVSWMRPLLDEYVKHIHSGFPKVVAQTAPSVLPSHSMPRTSIQPNARLATAPPRSSMRDDFKGLLTVTSKTLQLRNEKYNGSLPQNYGNSGMIPTNFAYSNNNEPSHNSSKMQAFRRVPTAVRLTPLEHSLKASVSDLKKQGWVNSQTVQRPKTTKQSLSNRVPSSYWNRQIHLPPIHNAEGHSVSKMRASKNISEKAKKSPPEPSDITLLQNLRKDSNSKRTDLRHQRLNKQDVIWRKTTSSLQPSVDSFSTGGSNQNQKFGLTEPNDTEVLDEDAVHTVEPFVTWLLSQVQSNACKASTDVNFDSATK